MSWTKRVCALKESLFVSVSEEEIRKWIWRSWEEKRIGTTVDAGENISVLRITRNENRVTMFPQASLDVNVAETDSSKKI